MLSGLLGLYYSTQILHQHLSHRNNGRIKDLENLDHDLSIRPMCKLFQAGL